MIDYKKINQYIEDNHPELKPSGKLYVLCSDKFKDNPVYACVQGGHAVAGYMQESFENYMDELLYDENAERNFWQNSTIVYLWYPHNMLNIRKDKNNPDKYIQSPYVTNSVSCKGVPVYAWHEPDQDNEITAMAFWENDLLDIRNHDPYFWGSTEQDAVEELTTCKKDMDNLKIVRITKMNIIKVWWKDLIYFMKLKWTNIFQH